MVAIQECKLITGAKGEIVLILKREGVEDMAVVLKNSYLKNCSIEMITNRIEATSLSTMCSPFPSYKEDFVINLSLQGEKGEVATGNNLEELFDPIAQKSVYELIKIINQKIENR